MEKLSFEYPASDEKPKRAHVGVVGSGDLEILLEPSQDAKAHVTVQTSVSGFAETWKAVLDRFFANYQGATIFDIRDCGATPGTVAMRLQQAVEVSRQ
ncbi:MAG TPA: malonate decarboxylase subunit delta [Terracidiphilus sp.]|nr:malonate decarboxylase subunit delta [Terracidiphilus sp.]